MTPDERNRLLRNVPLAEQAEAKAYLDMTPEEQNFWNYRELRQMRSEFVELQSTETFKHVLAQAGYTTLVGIGILGAIITGKIPGSP